MQLSQLLKNNIKMYIRVSSMSVIRVGRKCSRTSTLIAAALLIFTFFFLLALMTEHRIGDSEYFYRQRVGLPSGKQMSILVLLSRIGTVGRNNTNSRVSARIMDRMNLVLRNKKIKHAPLLKIPVELPTWGMNQSVSLEDYLDPANANSFLWQPFDSQTIVNGTSVFCGPAVKVLILVISAPYNFEARMAIRETWGAKEYLWRKGVRIAFVLGNSGNETCEELVAKESANFGDIIEEDFYDSYHNLTLKSMAMLKWVNLTCSMNNNVSSSPQFVLKTDDDIFINVDRLLKVAHDMPNAKMIGRLTCGAVPIADWNSKLYMPKYLYPGRVYPGYLSGTAYLLRGQIIPILLQNALSTPLIHLEDIYVTGMLARHSKIYPDDSPFFTYSRIDPKDSCAFRYMVNSHQMTPTEIRFVWANLQKPVAGVCTGKKQKWLRRIPRMTKRLRNLCLFR